MSVQLKASATVLRDAANTIYKLSSLVPAAEGQQPVLYVMFVASVQHQKAYMEFNRNGLRIRCQLGTMHVAASQPMVVLGMELDLFRGFRDGAVEIARNEMESSVSFVNGRSHGRATLADPSALRSPGYDAPTAFVKLPVGVVRNGLQTTLFSSQDMSVQGTGPMSRVRTHEGEFEVTTYDSMSGAVHRKAGDKLLAEIPASFDLVLPNRMMFSIFSQADAPELGVSTNDRMIRFATAKLDVIFPLSEYPSMDIAARITAIAASATRGFTATVEDLREGLAITQSFALMDSEIINVVLNIVGDNVCMTIKSAKIEHVCDVPISNHMAQDFQVQCDLRRLTAFLKLVRAESRITVLYAEHRILFQAPESIFAFAES